MLEIANLTGGWGPTTVVEGVSLSVANGETVALIGRNGVGKTTLLELIVGRARRIAGEIRLADHDLSAKPVHLRARTGLGHVPQEREVFASLTVRENLAVAARPGPWTEERVLKMFPSLAARIESLGRQLSGGEQQMLSIARALVGNPSVLLMDEPSEGLAPVVVEQLVEAMKTVTADQALAIVLVEQRIDIARSFADRYAVMDRGKIVSTGRMDALPTDAAELAEYFGISH